MEIIERLIGTTLLAFLIFFLSKGAREERKNKRMLKELKNQEENERRCKQWETQERKREETVMDTKRKHILISGYIAIALLVIALNPLNPYGYYILLRWVCCAIFAYFAHVALEKNNKELVWILGIIAFIYNPILPLHLNRPLWTIVNIATIFVIFRSFKVLAPKLRDPTDCKN